LLSSGKITTLLMAGALSLSACGLHDVNDNPSPLVAGNEVYSMTSGEKVATGIWYRSFGDEKLNTLIEQALAKNLTVVQALARLDQARAITKGSRSDLFPKLDAEVSSRKSWEDGDAQEGVSQLGGALNWEVDLFGRIRSGVESDNYETRAAAADVQAVRLALTADIAESYYSAIGQHLKLMRLEQQTSTDNELLDLNQLRFDEGLGTQVDVLQQQGQLADTQSLIPPVESNLRIFENTIDLLLGQAPDSQDRTNRDDYLPPDAALPEIGVPSDLLLNRPDLRAMKNSLIAADADIGAAIADRLPRITLTGSLLYADGAGFAGPVGSILGGLVAPLLDWGQRKAEVERNEALYTERLAAFTQAYLEAVAEVENTLYQEDRQREYVSRLETRRSVLLETAEKAQSSYTEGLTDYLPVLNAVKDLRAVERSLIDQRVALALLRVRLYRAVGSEIPSYSDIPSTVTPRT
jgi:NodT family efflux transporter outer membrane factor (OMF) lipoprotein